MARNNIHNAALVIITFVLITFLPNCGIQKCQTQLAQLQDSLNVVINENDSLYMVNWRRKYKIDSLQQVINRLDTVRIVVHDTIYLYDTLRIVDTVVVEKVKYRTRYAYKIVLKAGQIKYKHKKFTVYIADLQSDTLRMFLKNPQGQFFSSFQNVIRYARSRGYKVDFLTNGGIFRPDYYPEGLFIQNGKLITALNVKDGTGNFYLKPNGVWIVKKDNTTELMTTSAFVKKYGNDYSSIKYAIQSGPILVYNNKIHPVFRPQSTNLNIRSGVGVLNQHIVIFAISDEPVNLYTFASLFRDYFGCKNALYLDGAISDMYIPRIERYNQSGGYSTIIAILKK